MLIHPNPTPVLLSTIQICMMEEEEGRREKAHCATQIRIQTRLDWGDCFPWS